MNARTAEAIKPNKPAVPLDEPLVEPPPGWPAWSYTLLVGLLLVFAAFIAYIVLKMTGQDGAVAPSDTTIEDSTNSRRYVESVLKEHDIPLGDIVGIEQGAIDAISVINIGLDCSVQPIVGDQCPTGYVATRRRCAEGYCCILKEAPSLNNAGIVLAANLGINLIAMAGVEAMVRSVAKKAGLKGGTKASQKAAINASLKPLAAHATKASVKLVTKITTKLEMMSMRPPTPVSAAVAIVELINMAIDVYDPRGFMQFTSSEAFSAVRDSVEHQFITDHKKVMQGPPFLYPVSAVLTEQVKTVDGEADVCVFATCSEITTSMMWLLNNRPDDYTRITAAAVQAAISIVDADAACKTDTDACSVHTDDASCKQDPSGVCAFAAGACVNSNFIAGLLDAVPMAVRDAHFYAAIKKASPKSAELVSVFDRKVHTWFKGSADFPYAVSLTAAGRDRANSLRVDKSGEPSAFITRDYRDIGTGVWTMRQKNVDLDGVSDADKTSTTLNTITKVPRMVDKTIPKPLCLITMNDFLKPLCEDEKKGGLVDLIGASKNDNLGLKNQPPPELSPRDNLHPGLYGVRYDPDKAHCTFTKQYCDSAGLKTVKNQRGDLDCQLAEGQGTAELIFGTTLVRAVVASAENSGQSILALLDPARYYKKKPGETCKALTECNGVQTREVGRFVTCCPATKEVGKEVFDLTIAGGALVASGTFSFGASAIAGMALLDKASQLPRTCQVMDWTRTGIKTPFCPFDPANPKNGNPIKDGDLCGLGSSCERCSSKTQSFWKSKGFTACGVEPKWENGTRCGPGVTCDMCKNGSAAWDDGAHRCGPRVAGTTVGLKGACAYNNHCVAHTDTKEGTRTMCCDGKCERAVLNQGAWYCPGGVLGKTKEGGKCTIGGTCEGFTSTTNRHGCCGGVCRKQTKVGTLWKCPSELVKDKEDGVACTAGECLRCKNPSSFWYSRTPLAVRCGTEPRWTDGRECALGTSCNSCANKASMWSDGKIRCGKQGKTMRDGTLCGPGTSCNNCINSATRWRNGSYHCGTQAPVRCCTDTYSYNNTCLLKTGLPPLVGTTNCSWLLTYYPVTKKCHGSAAHRC